MMKNRLFYFLMLLLTMVTQGAWAMGELTGRFSVNETKQVYFSQGNLQAVIASGPTNTYNYTASKWKFAEHQWSYVGNNAGNNSFAAGTTVDLFGWVGTSASNITYGLCTYNDADGTYYGNSTEDALKSDWGTLAIENGGNTANSGWRTLTRGEWDYLFNTRSASTIGSTDNARYAKAKVNNVAGVILFPDRYTHPEGVTPPTSVNTATAKYTANKYSDDAWTQMETAGAVFLPAAGYRNGTSVGRAGEYGLYWSSSPNTSHGIYADHVHFYDNNMYLNGDDRQQGNCVRLVKDVTLTTDNTGAILINCTDDWTIFADDVNKGNTYSDQTVKLTADISGVTMMAGTEEHPFKGTFDGQRHTLTANITSSGAAALFGRVANATILNLHVAGFVTTTMTDGADHTGGLIGKTSGEVTIHDVRVSATVTGHTYYGGFIGNRGNSLMINMMGCVFDGTLTENVAGETQHAGGFIGWGGSSPYIKISYSLFAGTCTIATNGSGAHNFHPVGYYSSYNYEDPPVILTPDLSHVYYTVAPSAQTTVNFGAALSYHEKQAYTISTSDANVTTLDIDDYLGYEFPTSGLNFYATGGIEYGSTFYAGDGDKVNLALAHKDAAVGQHFTGYAVTGGGTLDDNTSNTPTLTMTAANQTISAVYADNPSHKVTFDITETGWSTTPSGTAREGETVTVSYQGEHKVKSVVVSRAFKKAADATATDLGKLICTDGHIHADDGNTEDPDCTKERVAMITYVGSDAETSTTYNHGLALALTDASTDAQWCTGALVTCQSTQYENSSTAKGDMAGIANTDALVAKDTHDHSAALAARNYKYADTAKAGAHPKGTSAWFLPSAGQWDKMETAAGGYANLMNNADLLQTEIYWSSTEENVVYVWIYHYSNIPLTYKGKSTKGIRVRPCIAF